jgi:hypothetical protein
MASQIEPMLVKDDILMVTDKLAYAVLKGGQNVSIQRFPSTSTSANSHVYQINVPSTSVVLDRHLLWHSEITINYTANSGLNTALWGRDIAPAPFPLHQLVQNMSCQINNTTVSTTTNQILDPILRCMDKKDLARFNSTTPVFLDNYGTYADIDSTDPSCLNSPFSGYEKITDPDYLPRGCTSATISNVAAGTYTVKFIVTEPIFLSPFLYGETEHKSAGIYGISNINFNMSMDSAAKRAVRFRTLPANLAVSSIVYGDSYIECRFLTPHPSDLLPETNIVPYQEFTNYIKTGGALASGASTTLSSNNVQLSSIPDKVFIWVRPQQSDLSYSSPDSYGTITGVNVTFNNQTGVLSSASPYTLYNLTQEAGGKQTWLEWSGVANGLDAAGTAIKNYSTAGGPLVLNFGEHINIPEDYYSCGSIGQFNFQVQVQVTNTTGASIVTELSVMFMQAGVFVTNNGVSSKYLGILSKEQVLQASLQEPVGKAELARLVGGGFFSRLWQGAKNVAGVVKKGLDVVGAPIRKGLEMIPHPIAQGVAKGLKAVGYGMSGGQRMAKHIM